MAEEATSRLKPCPICGRMAVPQFRPFCSRRCADVDLHRWLAGTYSVPAATTDDEEEAPDADAPPLDPGVDR